MTLLSKDEFLKAEDLAPKEVDLSDLPGYNGSMLVRGMTGRERDAFEISMTEQRGRGPGTPNLANLRAKLVARCVVDEDGNRVFTDADAVALGDKSGAAIIRLFAVASTLSGMGEDDMKEIARDFTPANGASSSSASPSGSAKQSKVS